MKQNAFRLCSMILVLALLLNMLPASALAEVLPDLFANAEATTPTDNVPTDTYVVDELVDKRTEFSKEFLLSNGLHMATVYADAVHYETDDGWAEIDNTLKINSDGTFSNTAGVWEVTFPQQLTEDDSITIEKDGYSLSFFMAGELNSESGAAVMTMGEDAMMPMSVTDVQQAEAVVQTPDLTAMLESAEYTEAIPEKLQSQISYADVYENTNVVYDLDSNQVKESMILERYNETLQGYRYILDAGEMVPVLEDDGQVVFHNADQTKIIMVMPAPFLVDDAGVHNDDVQVILEGGDGTYTMTYLLPTQWLAAEDRAWPVVLDPAVQPTIKRTNISDKTVASTTDAEKSNNWQYNGCGYNKDYGTMRTFLKYNELPNLTSSDVVVDAVMQMYKPTKGSSEPAVEVHKVDGAWESGSITWKDQNGILGDNPEGHAEVYIDESVEDYAFVNPVGWYYWTVTDIVRQWYAEGNTGMVFKLDETDETMVSNEIYKYFCSSDCKSHEGCEPALTIYFRNNNGLESYWDYTSTSAGRAGTGYVNNFTGNMVWARDDIGFGGDLMPVTISHYYNLNDAIIPDDSNNSNDSANTFGMGYGWRTNFNQLIYKWVLKQQDDDGKEIETEYYILEDADGTDHYFEKKDGQWRHEDDDKIILTLPEGSNTEYIITYEKGDCSYFDLEGRLVKLENNQKNKSCITIAYYNQEDPKSRRIASVTDGDNRVYRFTYNADRLLDKISYLGNDDTEHAWVMFAYEYGSLTEVTDSGGTYCIYRYDDNNKKLLLEAAETKQVSENQREKAYNVQYTYNTPLQTHQPYRVQSVSEFDDTVAGGTLTFAYGHNYTTITDHNGNAETVQFNDFGNTISIQDDEGRAQFMQYALNTDNELAVNTDATKAKNQLRVSSELQYSVNNLFVDNNMRKLTCWSDYGPDVEISVASNVYLADTKSVFVNLSPYDNADIYIKNGVARGIRSDAYSLAPGETHTFSCYIMGKTSDDTSVYLMAECGSEQVVSETLAPKTGWRQLQVSHTNTTNTTQTVRYYVLSKDGTQGFYMDCPQLERSKTASRYNLINNGDFTDVSLYGWSRTHATSDGVKEAPESPAPQLDERAFCVDAKPEKMIGIQQRIYLKGLAGDCLTLCGWAKGNTVPLKNLNTDIYSREFSISCKINYADGTKSDPFVAHFNPDVEQWQYTATGIIAEKDFWTMDVYISCNYLIGRIYFDGIQLYRDEFGSGYKYDNDGNIIAYTDSSNQTTTYEYESNNLTKAVLHTGSELTYAYDKYHNVTSAVTKEVLKYTFTYDDYGRNESVSITDGTNTLSSHATYYNDDEGNRCVSTTDTLGNQTVYCYDTQTNVLLWVQYPKDTDGTNGTVDTRTEYNYDDPLYRITSAAVTTDTALNLSANYSYTDSLLTQIETPSTTYQFTYGGFDLRTGVNINGHGNLATYEYTDDQNKYLKKLAYGNGDSVEYEYDDKGRVTKQRYEDSKYVLYTYGNDGTLATVYDSETDITTTYGYNYTGQLARCEEQGPNYSHILTYSYNSSEQVSKIRESSYGHDRYGIITYDGDNRVEAFEKVHAKRTYAYDKLDRLTSAITQDKGTDVFTTSYSFTAKDGKTSSQVSQVQYAIGSKTLSLDYTYDNNGNILSVTTTEKDSEGTITATHTTSYEYDSTNQLVRENNQEGDFTHTWQYDNAGNILTRTEYAYTTGSLENATPTDTVNYTYNSDTGWGDLLTSYSCAGQSTNQEESNGTTIEYDEIGNPETHNGWNLTWKHGRELASMERTVDGKNEKWWHTYNANGMRIKRSSGTTGYTYAYSGSELDYMYVTELGADGKYTGTTLRFTHAPDGTPLSVVVGTKTCYYVTNLQGDVIAIVDANGNKIVEYTYDAWGKVLSADILCSESSQELYAIAEYNPLRYRGYIYDTETGFYYVSSRYYDPEIGRWINADNQIAGVGGEVLGYNMFAYCMNNPVNMSDPTGNWPSWSNLLKGSAWLAVGITAVCVGVSVLTCGVAAPAMVAVAAVTVGAGALTAVNGAAEIGEAFTGYNVVRDTVFSGNQKAYDAYANTTAAVAEVGTAVCGGWLKSPSTQKKIADKTLQNVIDNPNSVTKLSTDKFHKIANKSSWEFKPTQNNKGYRALKGDMSIRYNMNGTRFDAAHFGGSPYWVISSAKNGTIKIMMP